jgi:hypothetical protein
VQILSQGRELDIVRGLRDGCDLKMNAFKLSGIVPERVRVDDAGEQSRRWSARSQGRPSIGTPHGRARGR